MNIIDHCDAKFYCSSFNSSSGLASKSVRNFRGAYEEVIALQQTCAHCTAGMQSLSLVSNTQGAEKLVKRFRCFDTAVIERYDDCLRTSSRDMNLMGNQKFPFFLLQLQKLCLWQQWLLLDRPHIWELWVTKSHAFLGISRKVDGWMDRTYGTCSSKIEGISGIYMVGDSQQSSSITIEAFEIFVSRQSLGRPM